MNKDFLKHSIHLYCKYCMFTVTGHHARTVYILWAMPSDLTYTNISFRTRKPAHYIRSIPKPLVPPLFLFPSLLPILSSDSSIRRILFLFQIYCHITGVVHCISQGNPSPQNN